MQQRSRGEHDNYFTEHVTVDVYQYHLAPEEYLVDRPTGRSFKGPGVLTIRVFPDGEVKYQFSADCAQVGP